AISLSQYCVTSYRCLVPVQLRSLSSFFFKPTATSAIYTLSLHDALPIFPRLPERQCRYVPDWQFFGRSVACRPKYSNGDEYERARIPGGVPWFRRFAARLYSPQNIPPALPAHADSFAKNFIK